MTGVNMTDFMAWLELKGKEQDEAQEEHVTTTREKRDNEAAKPGKSIDLGNRKHRLISTRMASYAQGAEYGLFFDVEAKDVAVEITGIKTAAHALANTTASQRRLEQQPVHPRLEGLSQPMQVSVYTCEGSSRGKELLPEQWSEVGSKHDVELPRIDGKEDWEGQWREQWVPDDPEYPLFKGEWMLTPERQEPIYGYVPLNQTFVLQPGEIRGFLLHTSSVFGIVNRWCLYEPVKMGDVSDQDAHIRIYACRAMPEEEAFTEERETPVPWCDGTFIKPEYLQRREEAHAFVGEVEYTVLGGREGGKEGGKEEGEGGKGEERKEGGKQKGKEGGSERGKSRKRGEPGSAHDA